MTTLLFLIALVKFTFMNIKYIFIALLFCFISGCNSDTENSEEDFISIDIEPDAFGKIIDSKVIGLRYISGEYQGITDENGRFGYILGEQIQFFIGDIALGNKVNPKEVLTPYDIAHENTLAAFNIARFLQSLDDDSVLDNGITIVNSSHILSKNKTLDFLSQEWKEENVDNSAIEQLVYLLTKDTLSGSRYLVSPNSAYWHFSSTLNQFISDKKQEILNEIDVTGCNSHNECGIQSIDTSFIGYCPPPTEIYVYSKTTTDYQKIAVLSEERMKIIDIKASLYSIADIPRVTGVCITSSQLSQYPSCNNDGICELSTNYTFDL